MNPVLAGLLPLLITLGLAFTALVMVGAFSYLMLIRQARGEFEIEEGADDDEP